MDDDKGKRRPLITEKDIFEMKVLVVTWKGGYIETERFVEAIRTCLECAMERDTGSRELPEGMREELDRVELAAHTVSEQWETMMDGLRSIERMFDREKKEGQAWMRG